MNVQGKKTPFENIIDALDSPSENAEEATRSLESLGYNVEESMESFRERTSKLLTKHTWKKEAEKMRAEKLTSLSTLDWTKKSDTELDKAIAERDFLSAARNMNGLGRDEKIAMLMSMEMLNEASKKNNP